MLEFIGLPAQQQSLLNGFDYAKYFSTYRAAIFSCNDEHALRETFHKHANFYIDFKTIQRNQPPDLYCPEGLGDDFIQLIMQTDTAYHFPVSLEIARHICRRYNLDPQISHEIETALHEATANAIIHGNLGLNSQMDSLGDFSAYYREVECRIQDETSASKLINITCLKKDARLIIMVSDQGVGFDISPARRDYQANKMHGNGRFLMTYYSNMLHYHNGGSSVEMHFHV